jgi:hypothetical protein
MIVVFGVGAAISPGRVVANAKASYDARLRNAPDPVGVAAASQAAQESALASEEPYLSVLGQYEAGRLSLSVAEKATETVSQDAYRAAASIPQANEASWQSKPENALQTALKALGKAAATAAAANGPDAFLAATTGVVDAFDRVAAIPETPLALPGGGSP